MAELKHNIKDWFADRWEIVNGRGFVKERKHLPWHRNPDAFRCPHREACGVGKDILEAEEEVLWHSPFRDTTPSVRFYEFSGNEEL